MEQNKYSQVSYISGPLTGHSRLLRVPGLGLSTPPWLPGVPGTGQAISSKHFPRSLEHRLAWTKLRQILSELGKSLSKHIILARQWHQLNKNLFL